MLLFALMLHLKCTALSQSESSNFFMYIIIKVTRVLKRAEQFISFLDVKLNRAGTQGLLRKGFTELKAFVQKGRISVFGRFSFFAGLS